MSAFEFFFSFYGLILGLSVVEVITGLVRVFKQRQRVRIGWLTPLLALFVMLDITSFWTGAWTTMQGLDVSYGLIVIGLAIAAIYYAAATLVTPDDLEAWPDFDVFYDRHKAFVMGGVIAANLIAFELAPHLTPTGGADRLADWTDPAMALRLISFWLLALALIVVKDRRVNIAVLVVIIATYLWAAIASF